MRSFFFAALGLMGLAVAGASPASAASATDGLRLPAGAVEHAAPVQDRMTVAQDQSDARRRPRRPARRVVRR